MDYLPIQASAVPCERIFSSSTETDTKKRNRIRPELMEALQILKFALKKNCRDFSAPLYLPEYHLTSDGARGANILTEMLKLKPDGVKVFLDAVDLNN
jgi:hAT family C-terminal dimerisation region